MHSVEIDFQNSDFEGNDYDSPSNCPLARATTRAFGKPMRAGITLVWCIQAPLNRYRLNYAYGLSDYVVDMDIIKNGGFVERKITATLIDEN